MLCATIAQAELPFSTPEVWNLAYEADDVLTAAKLAYITHNGDRNLQNTQIATAGFHVVNQETEGNISTIDVYGVAPDYDVSSGIPARSGIGYKSARIVLSQQGNTYTLLSYQAPGDGTVLWDDMGAIFGEKTRELMIKNQEEYARLCLLDADAEAEKYIEYLKTGVASGAWVEFLEDGSIPGAESIVRTVISGRYPAFAGKSVWYNAERLYTLTIEGEHSYSGILTYQCFDAQGEQLTYVKLTVQDGEVLVLEGELPPMFE
jgi:hypothetical protein